MEFIMYVKDVKRIWKVGKDLLKDKNAYEIISLIIEKPLQKACIECKEKNIETCMSSANKSNIVKKEKIINKKEIVEISKLKTKNFLWVGKGYTWLMINYNTLSDQNREILFNLEEELGEDSIWFVKCNYIEFLNKIRKPFRLKPLTEHFDDKYAEKFKEKQILMTYNVNYPRRAVFIRMPVDENTKIEDVECYFSNILGKLKNNNENNLISKIQNEG